MSVHDVKYIQSIIRFHYQNNSQKAIQIGYHNIMEMTWVTTFPLKIRHENKTSCELFTADLCKPPWYGW